MSSRLLLTMRHQFNAEVTVEVLRLFSRVVIRVPVVHCFVRASVLVSAQGRREEVRCVEGLPPQYASSLFLG